MNDVDIDQDSGIPKYRQLLTWLSGAIGAGEFPIGSQIPTETALCSRFGVSRITVRNAMQQIENDGLVKRERGRGTFVCPRQTDDEKKLLVAFILIDVSPDMDYNYREIHLMERYLSRQKIPFSWTTLTSEDLVFGNLPAVLEERMCDGLILDGKVTAAHFSLGARFGAKTIAVGNHAIPRDLPQLKFHTENYAREATLRLVQEFGRPLLLLVEPFELACTREIHRGYVAALATIGQSGEHTYLCPSDLLPPTFSRFIASRPTPFAIVTTNEIYPRLQSALLDAGIDPVTVPMAVFASKPVTVPAGHPVWQYINELESLHVLAAERLLDLIHGRRTEVYEELDLEVIPPPGAVAK